MQAIETLALSKAAKDKVVKQAREEVKSGTHPVDFTVRIFGQLNVGDDYEITPTASVPVRKALAALAYIAGCTGEAGVAKIEQAMRIALEADEKAGEVLAEMMPRIDAVERKVIAPMLAKLPKKPAKGKVTTKLDVTIIDGSVPVMFPPFEAVEAVA